MSWGNGGGMSDFVQITFLATQVQLSGTALVALLLVPLSRSMPAQFLRLWAVAWVWQSAALVLFFAAYRGPAVTKVPFVAAYLLAGQMFAFLMWAGCRKLSTDRGLSPRDGLMLAGPAVYAVVAPVWYQGVVWKLYPAHAAVLAAFFLMALWQAAHFPKRAGGPAIGRWLVRGSLAALAVLFAHYTVVLGFLGDGRVGRYGYLAYASYFDLLLQTALAFGVVVLAADRTRDVLEERNQALAAAAAELDAVARTDPLTGLLNRRGFEQVLAAHAGRPQPGAVAVLDLNDLKRLNDAHGHPAGDAALQLVARALRGRFRVTDPVCRTGGDEFAVLMSGCTVQELCGRLAGLDVELGGQRLPGVADPVDLRVAWGAAPVGGDLAAAHAAADQAMYARKRLMKEAARAAV